eukprot:2725449-Pleurochrysis_carterae.AAC.1
MPASWMLRARRGPPSHSGAGKGARHRLRMRAGPRAHRWRRRVPIYFTRYTMAISGDLAGRSAHIWLYVNFSTFPWSLVDVQPVRCGAALELLCRILCCYPVWMTRHWR